MAIVEDLEQIAARVVVERDQSEVVKHNEIGLGVTFKPRMRFGRTGP